ncbi:hypothetical protein AwMethylo_30220 [Methylobacterium sp.]|nr:hypothetical protein AwMethylo_30220 [Methylobacterium sp.]
MGQDIVTALRPSLPSLNLLDPGQALSLLVWLERTLAAVPGRAGRRGRCRKQGVERYRVISPSLCHG